MKKLLSSLLAIAMVITMLNLVVLPVTALISGNFNYDIIANNEIEINGYLGTDGPITIPDTIDGKTVTSIGYSAFDSNTVITSVTLPQTVNNISDFAFYNCTNLTGIVIPDSVTAIGKSAFEFCSSLSSVSIGSGVNFIGLSAFKSCISLSTINVSSSNLSYSSLDNVLFNNDKTLLVQFPLARTGPYSVPSGVNKIEKSSFYGSNAVTSVGLPSTITTLGDDAFSYCTKLESASIPDSVTSIGSNTFAYCTSLLTASIGNGLTTTGIALFSGCTLLQSVAFGSSIQTIALSAFEECNALEAVNLPDSVVSIGNNAFNNCVAMTNLTFGSGLKTIGNNAFTNCVLISTVIFPAGLTSIGISSFEGCLNLSGINVPDSVTSIGDSAFFFCTSLETAVIGVGLSNIGNLAFDYCTSLLSITVAGANSSYSSLDGVLFNKSKTILIRYPSAKTGGYSIPNGVTEIKDYAFSNSVKLSSIYIPNSVTTIQNNAFYVDPSFVNLLTNVTLGSGVTLIGDYAFDGCKALSTVYFLGNAPTIQFSVFSNTNSAITFHYASSKTGFTSQISGKTPTATIIATPTSLTYGNVSVSISAPLEAILVEYQIGNGLWASYTTPFTISSNNTVYARYKDPLNNDISLGQLVISNMAVPLSFNSYNVSQTNIITNVQPRLSDAAFTNGLTKNNATVSMLNSDGSPFSGTFVGTGSKLNVLYNSVNTQYTVLIYGDITGDGIINISDLILVKVHLLKINLLTGNQLLAAAVNSKTNVSVSDLISFKKQLLNIAPISQS